MSDEQPAQGITKLDSRVAYESPWMTVREDRIAYADGSHGIYSLIEKTDFAMVLAYENDGFWLVEEYRYPLGRRLWNFPQGVWPAGHDGTQEELAAAELREETGLRAQRFTHLGRLYTAVGYSGQAYDVFLAEGLTPGPTAREPGEADMVTAWRSRADLDAMIAAGGFPDGHSVAALALFDRRR